MKKLMTFILFVGAAYIGSAQNNNPLDEKYQPAASSIFGKSSAKSSQSSSPTDRKTNAVSFLLSDLARSSITFNYERKLSGAFSAYAGIGLPMGRDLIETLLNSYEISEEISDSYEEGVSIIDLYGDAKLASGFNGLLGLKFFYDNGDSYEKYIGIGWRMAVANYTLPNNGDYDPSSLEFKVNTNIASLMWGVTSTSGVGKVSFTHDLSYGLGVKFTYYDRYIETDKPLELQTDWNRNWNVKETGGRQMLISPVFVLRYQMGIGW